MYIQKQLLFEDRQHNMLWDKSWMFQMSDVQIDSYVETGLKTVSLKKSLNKSSRMH